MMTGNPFPNNAWLTYAEATARWGKPTSPKQVEYILTTPDALSDHPTVKALVAEAEARGMERAAVIAERHLSKVEINEPLWHEGQDWAAESIALAIRAEAATIRGETT